ncbi:hypothetical protein ABPG74_000878 [Tetrahymena malaccensis]
MGDVLTDQNSGDSKQQNDQKISEGQNCQQLTIKQVDQKKQCISQNNIYSKMAFLSLPISIIAYKSAPKIKSLFSPIVLVSLIILLINRFRNSKQLSSETIQDWERQFGLENFKEVCNYDYTKEDLDSVYKQKKIFWNPDKKKTLSKQAFAVTRLQQIEKAYKNILNYHNWN